MSAQSGLPASVDTASRSTADSGNEATAQTVASPVEDTVPSLRTQVVRFVLTGGFSGVVDFGLYLLLLVVVGWPLNLAKGLGFLAGTTTAYVINRRWTFAAPPSRIRFLAVMMLYAVTFCAQVGINNLLVTGLPEQWWRYPVAFAVAQGTATIINFVVQRTVIFRLR